MSGNPPSIVLLPTSSSSPTSNSSTPTISTHPTARPPLILHQQTIQSNASTPYKSVVVKPFRESIQQALTTASGDGQPIVLKSV